MADSANHHTGVAAAKQLWESWDFEYAWRVSWRNIREIYLSGRPFPEDAGLQNLIETWLRSAFQHEGQRLIGAALMGGDLRHEREFFRDRYRDLRFIKVHGYDLAAPAAEVVRSLDFAFESHAVDCNNLVLERDSLHLIVGNQGLHHLYNLGNLFFQCNQALKDGGLMYVEEYIGPRRIQLPKMNCWISWLVLKLLFSKRERTNHEGTLKGKWLHYPADHYDPTEACNSGIIEREMLHYFQPLHILRFGGLCYPVFEGLGLNFDKPSWRFRFVIYLERALQHLRIIKPLFVQAVLRKKKVW